MRVDLVHMRDPDYSCDLEIWIDGQRATFEEWSFDPGSGWDMSEFDENVAAAVEAAPEFLRERIAGIYAEMRPTYERWSC